MTMSPPSGTAAHGEPTPARRPLLGAGLLTTAAVIWGFAFVPQKLTVLGLPPLTATAIRFAIAAPLAILLAVAVARKGFKNPGFPLKHGVLLGAILFCIYTLQTAALVTAPVARVSLITGMYAVYVPLFAPLLGHARPTAAHWLGALLAFLGLLGLVGIVGDSAALKSPLNIGDAYVMLHALLSAFQVLLVGRIAKNADPVVFNAVQLSTVAVLLLPVALIFDGAPQLSTIDDKTWMAFGYLAALSTVVAFICQIFGQRHTSAPTAGVVMLMETPVGVLGALLFFDESMGWTQWVGALVLVSGIAVALWPELARKR